MCYITDKTENEDSVVTVLPPVASPRTAHPPSAIAPQAVPGSEASPSALTMPLAHEPSSTSSGHNPGSSQLGYQGAGSLTFVPFKFQDLPEGEPVLLDTEVGDTDTMNEVIKPQGAAERKLVQEVKENPDQKDAPKEQVASTSETKEGISDSATSSQTECLEVPNNSGDKSSPSSATPGIRSKYNSELSIPSLAEITQSMSNSPSFSAKIPSEQELQDLSNEPSTEPVDQSEESSSGAYEGSSMSSPYCEAGSLTFVPTEFKDIPEGRAVLLDTRPEQPL